MWESGGDTQILENGHLLRLEPRTGTPKESPLNWGGTNGQVSEYDWDGNLIWRHVIDSVDEVAHHSIHRMPNGNTLVLVWERISYDDAVAAGRDPDTISNSETTSNCFASQNPPGRYKCDLWPDKIVELDGNGEPTGWEWRAWDHIGTGPLEIDINFRFPTTKDSHRASADFMHSNQVDYYEESGNGRVVLNSRVFGEFFIIDYASGNIIDRWGNPCASGQGECPSYYNNGDQELFGQHSTHRIKPGYPGQGNFLIWDNGWMRPTGGNGRVVEVDLNTREIVWQYTPFSTTYTPFVGSVVRLANGNTLISITFQGHLIEVTPEKEIVWEFVNPMVGGEALCLLNDNAGFSGFAVRRYGPDYPGFSGKDFYMPIRPFSDQCSIPPYMIRNNLYGE